MTDETVTASTAAPMLRAAPVFSVALICLGAGLGIGYLMRGSQQAVLPAIGSAHPVTQTDATTAKPMSHRITLEQMRQMADKQAAPLLEKLRTNPNDTGLLVQVGAIYHTTHRFKEAADYYNRALEIDPKDVAIRTKLASSLYRNGDIEGSIAQLNRALTYDPGNANALFDLGMIKLQGKGDPKGALAAWQRLLKMNPQLSADRRATVLKLMADVMTMMGDQHGMEGARSNDGHQ
ncbi:tetratricopeptide repeat protein [Telmatobacter sp. DSM 110680]|uniref:Tetratricopeptide repeat protein n=1 Tax=Telmatobacter sp. DSM 110680 TaxID=3036704 RepID=A0AAU7DGC7_9BACT